MELLIVGCKDSYKITVVSLHSKVHEPLATRPLDNITRSHFYTLIFSVDNAVTYQVTF